MSDITEKYIELLADKPIYSSIEVTGQDIYEAKVLTQPNIFIYCDSGTCEKNTIHRCVQADDINIVSSSVNLYATFRYRCKHCDASEKLITLHVFTSLEARQSAAEGQPLNVSIIKIGEYPPFGPHIPKSASKMFSGKNRELFMKGLRSESQGLGIGAFSYYRRTLDIIKDDLIDQMIKVSEIIKASDEFVQSLIDAKKEDSFAKSIEKIEKIIPDGLKLNGQNPLSLLNTALSKGLHAKNDEECMEAAQGIKIILFNLLSRMGELLKDDKELKDTIKNLSEFSNES